MLSRDPAEPYSLNNKGYALMQSGKAEEAKALIERSLDKLPKNGYALRNLGIYFQQKGNVTEALNAFNKAIEIAEPVELLYGLTGQAYYAQKNAAEACKIWKQGVILKDSLAMAEAGKYCR